MVQVKEDHLRHKISWCMCSDQRCGSLRPLFFRLLIQYRIPTQLNGAPFKVVIFKSAERLSHECQTALRRIIETRAETNRFIFVSSSIGSMIAPIQSRCFPYRVPRPSDAEVRTAIDQVLTKEKLRRDFLEVVLRTKVFFEEERRAVLFSCRGR